MRAPRMPAMEGNALALMLTTAVMAALGLVFWAVAATSYSPEQVGRASAIVSSATLLASLAQLNLGMVYARLLPTRVEGRGMFILKGFLSVTGMALVLGAGFVLFGFGDDLWVSVPEQVAFPVYVVVLALFALQDFVLTALRAAKWVLVENVVFSVVKLGMLVAVAAIWHDQGIVLSWILPAAGAVLIVNFLVFTRAARTRPTLSPHARPLQLDRRAFTSLVTTEYLAGMVANVLPMILPLLVVASLGAAANAYFSMPWLVAASLAMLFWNIAMSLLVEASTTPEHTTALLRRALRLTGIVALAAGVVVFVAAPYLLRILGPGYAEEGTTLLRLMALAMPFQVIVVIWSTSSRLRHRVRGVVILQVATAGAVVTGSWLLLPRIGINAIGLCWLVAQAAAAVVLVGPLRREMRAAAPVTHPRLATATPTPALTEGATP